MRRRGATSPVVQPPRRGAPLLAGTATGDLAALKRKVQVARKQLQLADDDYRAILQRVTGRSSSRDCGPSHLDELLREFRRLGWKPAAPKGGKSPSQKAQVRMIYAIWNDMQPMLAVGGPSALRAFVERQTRDAHPPTGISAPEFLGPEDANRVIEGLKAWRARLRRQAKGGPA